MSLAALLFAAAAAAQTVPSDTGAEANDGRGQGAQVESARVTARILRPAVLKDGSIAATDRGNAARPQMLRREGRITYEFE
jgi:hypothetical protein